MFIDLSEMESMFLKISMTTYKKLILDVLLSSVHSLTTSARALKNEK